MPNARHLARGLIATTIIALSFHSVDAQDSALTGLWYAKRDLTPEVRGTLLVERAGDRWTASIAGRSVDVAITRDSVAFDVPGGGTFRGRFARDRATIVGHWVQPRLNITGMRAATPLVMAACGTGCYMARVEPLDDTFSMYLKVTGRADGTLGVFLRNPERNQGRFLRADNIVHRGDTVQLRRADGSVIATGTRQFGQLMGMSVRGSSFDFARIHPDSFTFFYPRGRPSASYAYARPRQRNDGWSVADPEDVGMSRERLTAMVRSIVERSVDSAHAHRVHAILVARRGKLVLEEYFHGEHAEKPHDTRSASKTLVAIVLGAAMQAGMKVSPDTRVFATMLPASATTDARKRAMTLRHLLTMASGLDCDDSSSTYHAGSETSLTDQDTNPDWKRTVLGLTMQRDPGALPIYCSINSYLAGEVVAEATGRSFVDLAWELIGEPLQMGRYHLLLAPHGEAYMGGGARFLARDFLKLAQLYANGGTWNGRRILSEAWVRESVGPHVTIGSGGYGYLWWTTEYEFRGRRIRAHHASGNGGQYTIFIPELELVMATYGGSYADRGGFATLRQLIPEHVLPAVVR